MSKMDPMSNPEFVTEMTAFVSGPAWASYVFNKKATGQLWASCIPAWVCGFIGKKGRFWLAHGVGPVWARGLLCLVPSRPILMRPVGQKSRVAQPT